MAQPPPPPQPPRLPHPLSSRIAPNGDALLQEHGWRWARQMPFAPKVREKVFLFLHRSLYPRLVEYRQKSPPGIDCTACPGEKTGYEEHLVVCNSGKKLWTRAVAAFNAWHPEDEIGGAGDYSASTLHERQHAAMLGIDTRRAVRHRPHWFWLWASTLYTVWMAHVAAWRGAAFSDEKAKFVQEELWRGAALARWRNLSDRLGRAAAKELDEFQLGWCRVGIGLVWAGAGDRARLTLTRNGQDDSQYVGIARESRASEGGQAARAEGGGDPHS